MNTRIFVFFLAGGMLVSCGNKQEPQSNQPNPAPAHGLTQGGTTGSAAGLTWRAPADWTKGPDRQMRVATYFSPSPPNGKEGGECAVFYFGAGEGGDVESNMARWMGQFEVAGEPVRSDLTVDGMKVHRIDFRGTYLASGGPMMGPKESKEGFRLLGAIVEGPQGSVFFKMTGPEASVAAAENGFNMMLESLSKPGTE